MIIIFFKNILFLKKEREEILHNIIHHILRILKIFITNVNIFLSAYIF